jgi:hypothetical protein
VAVVDHEMGAREHMPTLVRRLTGELIDHGFVVAPQIVGALDYLTGDTRGGAIQARRRLTEVLDQLRSADDGTVSHTVRDTA